MLQLRNTPDPECKLSPAQVLFGRPLRDAFSFLNRCPKFSNPEIQPIWHEAWSAKEDALRTRFAQSIETLNSHVRQLPQLQAGEKVFIQNQNGPHPKKWDRSGVILEPLGHNQYNVKVDGTGRVTKRNRRFLRQYTLSSAMPTAPPVHVQESTPAQVKECVPSVPEIPQLNEPEADPVTATTPAPLVQQSSQPSLQPPLQQSSHPSSQPLVLTRPKRVRNHVKQYDASTGKWN